MNVIDAAADPPRSILLQAASGEPTAARELLDATSSTVYGFIFARVGGVQETAEDLTQATYLEAMRSARTYRGDAAVETWLCAIARRQVAKHYKSERRRERLERKLRLVAEEPEPDEDTDDGSPVDAEVMIAALGRLVPLHRQVLVLKYLDGRSVEQIAEELGRSKIQVQSLLQRARSGLKRELEAAR
ncbi:MAG: RNA polymerase sigma factor [Actinomycetota bacterium]